MDFGHSLACCTPPPPLLHGQTCCLWAGLESAFGSCCRAVIFSLGYVLGPLKTIHEGTPLLQSDLDDPVWGLAINLL